jgi:two-component system CheB/CheR fusion protein
MLKAGVGTPGIVVGIGASAGGLEALERFFRSMPVDSGMAFVVIQHLSPDFKSVMDELLARFTRLAIVRVSEPVELRPNTIYLMPPNKELVIEARRLTLVDRLNEQPVHLPISRFFRSLAREFGDSAVAVVLSGTGSDGSAGVADVHDAGGLVLVQSVESAKFDGMPRAAIATRCVDRVLASEQMGPLLAHYALDPRSEVVDGGTAKRAVVPGQALDLVFERMREAYGIDFSSYRSVTIMRRIRRRMDLSNLGSLEDYCERVLADPVEQAALCADFLIGVTRFFRDPEAFELVRSMVPSLVDAAPLSEPLRIWVPGCATGEEAYTLAMLLQVEMEKLGCKREMRVFATDVQRTALRIAGEGIYDEASLASAPDELRERFFVPDSNGRFRVSSALRKTVLFSEHNLLRDVPFHRIDLVSCRNLLIYFEREPQARALAALHFALKVGGLLLLGPSESLGALEGDFETVDRVWRLHRKRTDARLPAELRTAVPGHGHPPPRAPSVEPRLRRVYDELLQRFMPPSVLVNERREVQHVFGKANAYLHAPLGPASLDVVAMCEGELRVAVSTALASAAKRGERVQLHGVRANANDEQSLIDVVAEPTDKPGAGARLYLLQFVPTTVAPPGAARPLHLQDELGDRIALLERELRDTRETLQEAIENLETANEELQASNEELLAGNEELQSTNEELHSVNEELYSVNAEHNQKLNELAAKTSDLQNLMAASNTAIVFTDTADTIRLFTPNAAQVLNLLPHDLGRPLAHVTSRVRHDDLLLDVAAARADGRAREQTVHVPGADGGRYFLRRVSAYQDLDRAPAGCVISFIDMTERRRVELAEEQRHELLKLVIDVSPAQIAVLDPRGVILATNRAWDDSWVRNGGDPAVSFVGMSYFDGSAFGGRDEDAASAVRMIRDVLEGREQTADLDYPCHNIDPSVERWFWMHVARLPSAAGGAVVAHTDITIRKREEALEHKLLETAKLESLGVLAGGIAHDFNNILTGIVANVSAAREDVAKNSPAFEALADAELCAVRAGELCKQMLSYSGRGKLAQKPVSLERLIADSTSLIRAAIRKGTELREELSPGLPPVIGDEAKLQQVIMNLALNGSEALPERGGSVVIAIGLAAPVPLPGEIEVVAARDPSSAHVCCSVTDNGSGMDRDTISHIFEPFFTTKFTGRGLGLAAVLGIVRGHGGALFVRSELGSGTTFRVLLPAAAQPVATSQPHAPAPATAGRANILLVDDEPAVRNALRRVLERAGHVCTLAESGDRALRLVDDAERSFDLVLLDLTMPGLDGVETLERIRNVRPRLPVVMFSAFPEDDVRGRFVAAAPNVFLQKPIRGDELLAAVGATLGRMRTLDA